MSVFVDAGSGALFPNDKGGVAARPDSRGNITIDGVEYKLSGWTKTIKSGKQQGKKMISLSVQREDKGDLPVDDVTDESGPAPDEQEEIPF